MRRKRYCIALVATSWAPHILGCSSRLIYGDVPQGQFAGPHGSDLLQIQEPVLACSQAGQLPYNYGCGTCSPPLLPPTGPNTPSSACNPCLSATEDMYASSGTPSTSGSQCPVGAAQVATCSAPDGQPPPAGGYGKPATPPFDYEAQTFQFAYKKQIKEYAKKVGYAAPFPACLHGPCALRFVSVMLACMADPNPPAQHPSPGSFCPGSTCMCLQCICACMQAKEVNQARQTVPAETVGYLGPQGTWGLELLDGEVEIFR